MNGVSSKIFLVLVCSCRELLSDRSREGWSEKFFHTYFVPGIILGWIMHITLLNSQEHCNSYFYCQFIQMETWLRKVR